MVQPCRCCGHSSCLGDYSHCRTESGNPSERCATMKRCLIFSILFSLITGQQIPSPEQSPRISKRPTPTNRSIRQSVQTYVEAFNRGDAAAVAAHWSENGEWVNPAGDRIKGRTAIHKNKKQKNSVTPGAQEPNEVDRIAGFYSSPKK